MDTSNLISMIASFLAGAGFSFVITFKIVKNRYEQKIKNLSNYTVNQSNSTLGSNSRQVGRDSRN